MQIDTSRWKSIRASNAIERLREESEGRIKTQTAPPSAEGIAEIGRRMKKAA
jgi:hypothetical protein